MCVNFADVYRDSLILQGNGRHMLDSEGNAFTVQGFIESKLKNNVFTVRAVRGNRGTGQLVFHDMLQFDHNEPEDWTLSFEELLLCLPYPRNCYPFADVIGNLAATILDHVMLCKQLNLGERETIADVKSLVLNKGTRLIFEPFNVQWKESHPKQSYHFPLLISTLMFDTYGCFVQVN